MASPVSAFGVYRPLKTPIHRLDGRVKVILLIVMMVVIFIPYGNPAQSPYPYATSMIVGAGLGLIVIGLAALARVQPLRFLKAVGGMWFLLVFIILLNVFFYRPGENFLNRDILFYAGTWPVYETSFWFAGYVCERVILTILATLVITSATEPMEISYAFEFFLSPLKLVKIPVAAFSMMMSLALRFIPVLSTQANRIQKAQAARGLDARNGRLKDRFKSVLGLIIPLLMISIMDAVRSAEAMQARGYDPRAPRTHLRTSRFGLYDLGWLLGALLLLAGLLFLCLYRAGGLRLEIFPA